MIPTKLTEALVVVTMVLWLATPATAQPVGTPVATATAPSAEQGRPALPVIGTILEHGGALGLSASQVEALERLGLDFIREAIRRQADLLITQIDLDLLLDQEPSQAVDVKAAEAKLREIEKIRTDLQLALIRAVENARAQLTPEQRSKLAALLAGAPAQSEADPPDDPPSAARGAAPAGRGGAGHAPPGGGATHPRPPERRFEGRRDTGRRDHGRAVIRGWSSYWWEPYWFYAPPPAIVQEQPPVYGQSPEPPYWYYCRSAQTYYPYVSTCPEPWLPVPATPR